MDIWIYRCLCVTYIYMSYNIQCDIYVDLQLSLCKETLCMVLPFDETTHVLLRAAATCSISSSLTPVLICIQAEAPLVFPRLLDTGVAYYSGLRCLSRFCRPLPGCRIGNRHAKRRAIRNQAVDSASVFVLLDFTPRRVRLGSKFAERLQLTRVMYRREETQ